jgi:DNA (cytosine-5)-methyltransferase 1
MKHGSLFSGIGGFDLAAEWMGWENVFHCEWNTFGQKVLKHYWPKAESFNDITKSDFTKYANTIDIISGGFPCQPYSSAGQTLGQRRRTPPLAGDVASNTGDCPAFRRGRKCSRTH